MSVAVHLKEVNSYLTKSNAPVSDYSINPYVGCPHGCKYCFGRSMKCFARPMKDWGQFVDVKLCRRPLPVQKLAGKTVAMGTVTDCYNPYEETYRVTRDVLRQLAHVPCRINITTKSGLVLRDLDLLSQCCDVEVAISLNTLDERFRAAMEEADMLENRIEALRQLHAAGIRTVLFMAPIFPVLTDYRAIIERTKDFVDEYWFEKLDLRGACKPRVLAYIEECRPDLLPIYNDIYIEGNGSYWHTLSDEIEAFCDVAGVDYRNYFAYGCLVSIRPTGVPMRATA